MGSSRSALREAETPKELMNLTMNLISNTNCRNLSSSEQYDEKLSNRYGDQIPDKYTAEIVESSLGNKQLNPNDLKWGLPQGLSTSPLLATLAIEMAAKGKELGCELNMFVDDGIA